ncbi:hypothetical protein COD73_28130, partial [Bacillus cereus]
RPESPEDPHTRHAHDRSARAVARAGVRTGVVAGALAGGRDEQDDRGADEDKHSPDQSAYSRSPCSPHGPRLQVNAPDP